MSSAYDLSRLISFAAADERIAPIMRTATYSVHDQPPDINIHSTNRLVMGGDMDVMGGKTGFISKAGYCLATLLRLPPATRSPSSCSARDRTRPLLGDAPPVQLAVRQGVGDLRQRAGPQVSQSKPLKRRRRLSRTLYSARQLRVYL